MHSIRLLWIAASSGSLCGTRDPFYAYATGGTGSRSVTRSDDALLLQFRNLAVLVPEFPQHLDSVLRQNRRRTRELGTGRTKSPISMRERLH